MFEALKGIMKRLPFKVPGIDSDNGSEFINAHLLRFCEEEEITFTRARAGKKNDNCFVEQKNYSVARRAVGYRRYEGGKNLKLLNELYDYLRLYTNFFQPVMKLVSKGREGPKVNKIYDKVRTPYQRVPDCPLVGEKIKEKLKEEYLELNPAELKREITRRQSELQGIGASKKIERRN